METTMVPNVEVIDNSVSTTVGTNLIDLRDRLQFTVIQSDSQLLLAGNLLSDIRKYRDELEKQRTGFVKPLNDTVKKINEVFKTRLNPLDLLESSIKAMMQTYQTKKVKEQTEARIKAEEEARMKAAMDVMAGKAAEVVVIKPIIQDAPKTISSEAGKVTFRDNWKYRVVDINLIPRNLMIENPAAINAQIAAGAREKSIPGIEIYNEPIPVTNRR